MAKKITGTVKYIDLEGGFWGIVTKNENYAPVDFPEQLKEAGTAISCTVVPLDLMTTHNWGVACRIFSFTTITPRPLWNT